MADDKSAAIEVVDAVRSFGDSRAIDHISLKIAKGEILSLVGPSGCGKTTTLRAIAGLDRLDEGEIYVDGVPVFSSRQGVFVPAEKRDVGLVFQSYALFPHMTVYNNVAYGLRSRKFSRDEIKRRIEDWLGRLGLADLSMRYPSQLSGGEQQRVALARSLVYDPKLILLDEPLSNLDMKVREKVRYEVHTLLKKLGTTALYVTHDQEEAYVISDRVLVMNHGRIIQEGRPEDIYSSPRDNFVATFIGRANMFAAKVADSGNGGCMLTVDDLGASLSCRGRYPYDRCSVLVRPDEISFVEAPDGHPNTLSGEITYRAFRGSNVEFKVAVGRCELLVIVQRLSDYSGLRTGTRVNLRIPEKAITVVPV